jgi:hypothetical protein
MYKIITSLSLACSLTILTPVWAHDSPQPTPLASQSASQMGVAATKLLANFSEDQLKNIIFPFISDKDRTNWTKAPVSSKARNGLPIGRLSIEQRKLLHKLLIASTSSQGYQKIWAAVRGDDELKLEGQNRELNSKKFFDKNQSLGANNYCLSFYGDARNDSKWGYMITGHHLAANFTVVDGKATFVPMFYGADPAIISTGKHAGHEFLPYERARGLEFLNSLTPEQKEIAVIAEQYPANKYGAVGFAGPGKKDAVRENQGITADKLDAAQLRLLWILIEEYIGNADFDVAATQLTKIKDAGMNNLYFSWMGPTDGSGKVFFRVKSPALLIDFVDQRTGFDWNTHPHTIVRDPSNDYGQNWLERHIDESH